MPYGDHVGLLQLADHLAALVLVGRRAAHRREVIEAEREESLGSHAPGDVLDVRIESAVLVYHDHGRQLAAGFGLDQITLEARRTGNIDHRRPSMRGSFSGMVCAWA